LSNIAILSPELAKVNGIETAFNFAFESVATKFVDPPFSEISVTSFSIDSVTVGKSLSFILNDAELSVSLNVPPLALARLTVIVSIASSPSPLTPVRVTVALALPAEITTCESERSDVKSVSAVAVEPSKFNTTVVSASEIADENSTTYLL